MRTAIYLAILLLLGGCTLLLLNGCAGIKALEVLTQEVGNTKEFNGTAKSIGNP